MHMAQGGDAHAHVNVRLGLLHAGFRTLRAALDCIGFHVPNFSVNELTTQCSNSMMTASV